MEYALITGASKGIGKAIARELASRGIPVLLVARTEKSLEELAADISQQYHVPADYLALDLSDTAAPALILQWLKEKTYTVSMLVNNAGYGLSGAFTRYSCAEHEAMMQVNMHVPLVLSSLLLPSMQQLKRAYILNIASAAAYQAVPGLSSYAATKSFLVSFSRGLRYELRNTPVSVTVVSPGGTHTDFAERAQVGAKAVKAGQKLNMTPEAVAKEAVDAMLAGKAEHICGWINRLGAFLTWLFPKAFAEKTAAGIYEVQ
jgi:short-subunit dehydrogenase